MKLYRGKAVSKFLKNCRENLTIGAGFVIKKPRYISIGNNCSINIRLCAQDTEDIYSESDKFAIGKATQLRPGDDAAIISTGIMMYEAVAAADILLKEHSVKVRVLQMASIKPIDRDAIIKAAEQTRNIVTVEEHNIFGGLGSAVCEVAAETGKARVKRIGINDRFSGVGSAACLMKQEGLTIENIVHTVYLLVKGQKG